MQASPKIPWSSCRPGSSEVVLFRASGEGAPFRGRPGLAHQGCRPKGLLMDPLGIAPAAHDVNHGDLFNIHPGTASPLANDIADLETHVCQSFELNIARILPDSRSLDVQRNRA